MQIAMNTGILHDYNVMYLEKHTVYIGHGVQKWKNLQTTLHEQIQTLELTF